MLKCNFPLICGISKGVCCKYCDKKCNYSCELDPHECDLSCKSNS